MLLWLTYYNPMACWSRGAAPQGELGNDAMCAPEIERELCADNIRGDLLGMRQCVVSAPGIVWTLTTHGHTISQWRRWHWHWCHQDKWSIRTKDKYCFDCVLRERILWLPLSSTQCSALSFWELRCDLCQGTMSRNNVISSGECSEVSAPSPRCPGVTRVMCNVPGLLVCGSNS